MSGVPPGAASIAQSVALSIDAGHCMHALRLGDAAAGRRLSASGALLLGATPAFASKDGMAFAEGLVALYRYGFLALLGSVAVGLAIGAVLARWKQRPLGRSVALSIGAVLSLIGLVIAAWIFQTHRVTQIAVAHQRALEPFRAQARNTVERSLPGQVRPAIDGLMNGVPAAEHREKALIVLSAWSERMMSSPADWSAADTAAIAAFADAAFADDPLRANFAGHAIAIDWLNGREDSAIACTGQWASTCQRSVANGLSTACARQFGRPLAMTACAPAPLSRAKERVARMEAGLQRTP